MKILFCGDSITNGFPFSRSESFPNVLADLAGIEAINVGANGISSGDVRSVFEMHVHTTTPDAVHIMCGSNDFVFGSGGAEAACENVKLMAEECLEMGITPIVAAPPLTDANMASRLWMSADYDSVNEILEEYRHLLVDYCRANSILFFDLQEEYKKIGDYVDGVHPTVAGQKFIAEKLKKLLSI
ncbi:MAG: hypothetical protein IJ132_00460 [Firmicutes bacterium]|nr:hypothetical protein [Bacillota bacterium]